MTASATLLPPCGVTYISPGVSTPALVPTFPPSIQHSLETAVQVLKTPFHLKPLLVLHSRLRIMPTAVTCRNDGLLLREAQYFEMLGVEDETAASISG